MGWLPASLALLLAPALYVAWQRTGGPAGSDTPGRMEGHLNSLRHNRTALADFAWRLPKGGDIHLHASCAVPAEELIQMAAYGGAYLCPDTLQVGPAPEASGAGSSSSSSSSMNDPAWDACSGRLPLAAALADPDRGMELHQRLVEAWSLENFDFAANSLESTTAAWAHFSAAYLRFAYAYSLSPNRALQSLKRQAALENILYLEVMVEGLQGPELDPSKQRAWDEQLLAAQAARDASAAQALLLQIHEEVVALPGFGKGVQRLVASLEALHQGLEDSNLTLRFQLFADRTQPTPSRLLADLAAGAAACAASPVAVGLNLVGPEANPSALAHYWLHMQLLGALRRRWQGLQLALHAGELSPGQVPPKEVTWHIREAVQVVQPDRIGHGVALLYEDSYEATLEQMKAHNIALEVMLSSNEALLGVGEAAHSFQAFRAAGVPWVVASDDPGFLRTTLSEQYLLLFERYNLSYAEAKQAAFASIRHSFIKEEHVRQQLEERLSRDFASFEQEARAAGYGARMRAYLAGSLRLCLATWRRFIISRLAWLRGTWRRPYVLQMASFIPSIVNDINLLDVVTYCLAALGVAGSIHLVVKMPRLA